MNAALRKPSTAVHWAAIALHILPLIAFLLFTSEVLPLAWQFANWSELAKGVSTLAFGIWFVADIIFGAWYLHRADEEDEKRMSG